MYDRAIPVRQLSLLFFTNDLISGLNGLHKGDTFGENKLCCLAYADGVLLFAESENYMQDLLILSMNSVEKGE